MDSGWVAAGGEAAATAVVLTPTCSQTSAASAPALPPMLLKPFGDASPPSFSCAQAPPPWRSPLNHFPTPLFYCNQILSTCLGASC